MGYDLNIAWRNIVNRPVQTVITSGTLGVGLLIQADGIGDEAIFLVGVTQLLTGTATDTDILLG